MKRRKIKHTDQRSVRACIEQLKAIVDGLESGRICLEQDDDALLLRPGGTVDFELRVEQLTRRETLRLDMTWHLDPEQRMESERAPSEEAAAEKRGPISTRPQDSPDWMAAGEFQRLYSAARTLDGDGQWRIDQDRLVESLARAGIDPLTQQELYTLCLQADADERTRLFSDRMIDALRRAS
jgi:amphi-Trp domain-containing protein